MTRVFYSMFYSPVIWLTLHSLLIRVLCADLTFPSSGCLNEGASSFVCVVYVSLVSFSPLEEVVIAPLFSRKCEARLWCKPHTGKKVEFRK